MHQNALQHDQFSDDEHSGIHRRLDVVPFIIQPAGDEPTAVYVVLDGQRFFLGVRFELGVVPSPDWEHEMLARGIPARVLTSVWAWLRCNTL